MVYVDGTPALCTGMACNFDYIESVSVIDRYEMNEESKTLTIHGSDFLTPEKIEMGLIECTNPIINSEGNKIDCEMADDLPAGKWIPKVTESKGIVRIDPSVTSYEVDLP